MASTAKASGTETSTTGMGTIILILSTLALIGSFLVREIADADTWWQVAIGRHIVEQWTFPVADGFSAAGFGRPYHDSHWLFQVAAALADRVAGLSGVNFLMMLTWTATFSMTYRALRCRLSPAAGCMLVLVVAIACSDRFTPRPDIVTSFMIAFFSHRLSQGKYRSLSELALLVFMQIIWTNSHGLFVIGPFMAGCWCLQEVAGSAKNSGGDWKRGVILVSAVTLATAVTPFGFSGWRYAALLASEAGPAAPALFKSITELVSVFSPAALSAPDVWCFFGLLALALVSLMYWVRRKNLSIGETLVVVALCVAAFSGRRNIPLFALSSAPLIAKNLTLIFQCRRMKEKAATAVALLLLGACWFPLSGRYYQMINYPVRTGTGVTPVLFSDGFPRFFDSIRFNGQIYNSNSLGGYLLYHGIRPLTDGRWEVYDPKEIEVIFGAAADPGLWRQVVSRYDIRGVLLQHGSTEAGPLLPRLHGDPGWRLVFVDSSLSFWMRADLPDLPPQVVPARFAATVKPPARAEEWQSLGVFFAAVGVTEQGIAFFRRAVELGGSKEMILPSLGRLLSDTGRFDEAERCYLMLLRRRGQDTAAMNELAYLAARRGDLRLAESYLRRALTIKPADPDLAANYRRITAGGAGTGSPQSH